MAAGVCSGPDWLGAQDRGGHCPGLGTHTLPAPPSPGSEGADGARGSGGRVREMLSAGGSKSTEGGFQP